MRAAWLALAAIACGGSGGAGSPDAAPAPPPALVVFDPTADLHDPDHFYDVPYPSDLHLAADGTPDLAGFPARARTPIADAFAALAEERPGFPVVPVAFFRLTVTPAPLDPEDVIPAAATSPLLLIDVDPASPERGRLFPTVASTPPRDRYVPANLVTVAPRPGFVLAPGRRYAFVVMRTLPLAEGALAGNPALELGDDLGDTLASLEIDPAAVAGTAVFTTGDVVAWLADLSNRVLARDHVTIEGLHVDPDDGAAHERYCELVGTVRYPQFQKGTPPFDTDGLFVMGGDGLPVRQREEVAPVVLAIPKTPMPAAGYPLMIYFHGSGGFSSNVVDRGPVSVPGGVGAKGMGPAHVVAAFGIASAGSALPVNPQRLPGADEQAYLNISNLPAFRDTFRQGVLEQRLFLAALKDLRIPREALAGCELPEEDAYFFDPAQLVASGQSMGGMYTNLIAAVEPRIRAVVPTGAGGFWTYMILKTSLVPGASSLASLALATTQDVTFMHPGMALVETGWEVSDPLVYMPRLGLRPLPGHPARSIYEPVGKDDQYFPTVLYDAVALAYGNDLAGPTVWSSMEEAVSLGLHEHVAYPVTDNLRSVDGAPYTGVVVQFMGDGIDDPHAIYAQLDEVKYQYGCFLATFLASGSATVLAPAALGTPCLASAMH